MKFRIIAIIFLCLILVSCREDYTVNGKGEYPEITHDTEGRAYVVNTMSRVYHKESCRYAMMLDGEKKWLCYDRDYLTEKDYTPCGACLNY